MAKDSQDILLTATLNLSGYAKQLDEMVKLAQTKGKLIADALGVASRDSKPATGAGSIAKPPPRDPKPSEDTAAFEARRIAAIQRSSEIASQFRRRESSAAIAYSKLTFDQLYGHVTKLQDAKRTIGRQITETDDKEERKRLQIRKRAIEDSLRLASRERNQRPEALLEGKAASQGFLGLKRFVEPSADHGTAKFEAMFKKISPAGADVSGFAKKAAEGVKELGHEMTAATPGGGAMLNMLKSIGPAGVIAAGAVAALSFGAHELVELGEKFHHAFSAIRIGTGATGPALEGLKETMKETFASGAFDLNHTADTVTKLNVAFDGVSGEPLKELATQFEQLKGFGKETDVNQFARAANSFGLPAAEAGESLDKLFVISQHTGVGIDQLSSLVANSGAPMRAFGFSFSESAALMGRWQQQGVKTESVMSALKVAQTKLAEKGIGLRTGLEQAITAIKGAGTASAATSIAMKTFGSRGASEMADTIRRGKFEIEDFLKTIENSPESIGKASKDTASFGETFTKLGNQVMVALEPAAHAVTALVTGVVQKIGPLVSHVLSGVGSFVTGAVHFIEHAGEKIGELVETIGGIGPAFAIVAGLILGGPIGAIIGGIAALLLQLNEVQAFFSGFGAAVSSFFGSIGEGISQVFSGDILGGLDTMFNKSGSDAGFAFNAAFREKLNEEQIKDAIEGLGEALDKALERKDSGKAAEGVQELLDKYNAATSDIEKQSIAKIIEEQFPGATQATELFNDKTGETETRLNLNTEALQRFIDKKKEDADDPGAKAQGAIDVLKGLEAQGQQIDENREKVKKLEEERAATAGAGLPTKKIDADLESARKAAEETQKAFAEKYKQANDLNVFDGIDKVQTAKLDGGILGSGFGQQLEVEITDVEGRLDGLKKKQHETIDAMSHDEAIKALGAALSEGASLKGKLTGLDDLDALSEKFKSAKTEAERNSIAKLIQQQMPEAVTATDDLGNAIGINTAKVKELTAAQRKGLTTDFAKQQAIFGAGMKQNAEDLVKAKQHAIDLRQKLSEAPVGQDTKGIRDELDKTTESIKKQTGELGNTVKKGKEFGFIKGDIHQVGTAFHTTAGQAREIVASEQAVAEGADDAAAAVGGIGDEFLRAKAEAESAANAFIAEGAALVMALKNKNLTDIERDAKNERLKIVIASAKEQVGIEKNSAKALDDFATLVGKKEADRDKGRVEQKRVNARDTSRLDRDAERARQESAIRLANIDNDYLRQVVAAQDELVITKLSHRAALAKLDADIVAAAANASDADARAAVARLRADRAFLVNTTQPNDITLLNGKLAEVLEKGRETLGNETLGIADSMQKGLLAVRQAVNDALTPIEGTADLATVEKQGAERLALIRENGDLEIRAQVASSKDFQAAVKEKAADEIAVVDAAQQELLRLNQGFSDKKEELDAKVANNSISQADADSQLAALQPSITAAKDAFKAASKALSDRFVDIRESTLSELLNTSDEAFALLSAEQKILVLALRTATIKTDREIAQAKLEERKKQRAAGLNEMLQDVTDSAEREKITSLAALDDQLDEERIKWKEGSAQRLAIEKEFAEKRLAVERDYQRKKNFLLDVSIRFAEAMIEASRKREQARRDDDLATKLAELRKEEADLFASLSRKEITYAQYNDRLNAIDDKRNALTVDGQKRVSNVIEGAYRGLLDGLQGMQEGFRSGEAESQKRLAVSLSAASKDGFKDMTGVLEDAAEVGKNAIGDLFGTFAKMAENGKATIGDFADATMLKILDVVEATVSANVFAIFAWAMGSFLGPVAGAIAATVGVAALIGFAEKAKADIHARLGNHGFKGGGYTGDGNPDEYAGPAHKGELYFEQPLTKKHRPFLESLRTSMQAGMDPTAFLAAQAMRNVRQSDIVVPRIELSPAARGIITQHVQATISHRIATEIEAKMSPIVERLDAVNAKLDAIVTGTISVAKNTSNVAKNTGQTAKQPAIVTVNFNGERVLREQMRRG